MKRRTAGILLGFCIAAVSLGGCGTNEATEAASESAQTEGEGTGELSEDGEKTEDAEVNGEDASGDTADKDSDNEKEEDKGGSDEKTASDSEKTEQEDSEQEAEDALKVAVLLPDEEEWSRDAEAFESSLEEDGYEPVICYAQGDISRQVLQIRDMLEEQVAAFIIAPVDPYGLPDVLADVREADIPVFSYDDLIMDTNAVNYYTAYGGRLVGRQIGEEIAERQELDQARENRESRTIEFFMGSLDDSQALFVYNGIMEILQPYFDDGTLECPSGRLSFDDTGLMRWSGNLAADRMEEILDGFYEEGEAPDIICTGFDEAALEIETVLDEYGIHSGTEAWPMITGVGCDAEAVKTIASGRMEFSIFMDPRTSAEECENMVDAYLIREEDSEAEDPEVNDYESYDNGVKIVGAYLCEAQVIDGDNFEILIDNGFYSEAEVRPEATPTPVPTASPTPTEEPENTATPTPEATVTPAPSEEPEAAATPTPSEEPEAAATATPSEEPEATVTPKPRVSLKTAPSEDDE